MPPKPIVLESLENAERDRCVDLFRRADGSFGFEEYRRDPEDQGRWTTTGHYAHRVYAAKEEALAAARAAVTWLRA
jgi:hypothetical protein